MIAMADQQESFVEHGKTCAKNIAATSKNNNKNIFHDF